MVNSYFSIILVIYLSILYFWTFIVENVQKVNDTQNKEILWKFKYYQYESRNKKKCGVYIMINETRKPIDSKNAEWLLFVTKEGKENTIESTEIKFSMVLSFALYTIIWYCCKLFKRDSQQKPIHNSILEFKFLHQKLTKIIWYM